MNDLQSEASSRYERVRARPELPSSESDITFKELLSTIWRRKVLIATMSIGCGLIAALASLLPQKEYQASVLVSIASDDLSSGRMGGLGSLLSQYGDLASLAGISLSNGGKKSEALAVLQSEELTERYVDQNHLLPVLFSDLWDAKLQRWRTSNPEKVPTLWKANRFFKENVRKVTEDSKTGLVTLTITWKNAHIAAKWANDLIRLTNTYLRNKAIDESERNIAYLNSQVAKTTVVDLRSAIFTLMEAEIRKEMVARGSEEYAFKVLDPATPPEKPSFPNRLVWALAGVSAGLLVSLLVAFATPTVNARDS